MAPRELPKPDLDPKDAFEERRRESIKRFLHSKMNEYGWCIRTGDVKGRKRGKHGDMVCLTEDVLLVVTTLPGSERYGDPLQEPSAPIASTFTIAHKISYGDIRGVGWNTSAPNSVRVSTDSCDIELVIQETRRAPARLWAQYIRLKVPHLRWIATDDWSIERDPLFFWTSVKGREDDMEMLLDTAYGTVRCEGVVYQRLQFRAGLLRIKHDDFSARYCIIRDATMFLHYNEEFFATRVFNGYYDLSGPPWNQEMTFPWSKFGEILERSQDPPLAGPKTYLGFSEPSSIIPLAAIKQVRCIDHPNEYPQLLVATAKHSLSLAFSNEGERSKWVEAINWRPPLVNLTGSAADPAPPRNLSTVVQIGNHPVANGGFAWVYQGTWDDDGVIKNVAVKVIRKQDGTDLIKLNKRLRREVKVWNRLSHENILELYGVSYDHGPFASMICPWMEGGTLSAFITPETRINKRLKLLYDVGKALVYLHSEGVVHGDLTTANVLIDAHENAVLSDFGLSTILAQFSGTSYMSTSLARGGALRWADPALSHVGDDPAQPLTPPSPTLTSDIYSFGCVLYHVISGRIPFQDLDDLQVIFAVSARGERPPRPQKVEDPCWEFMEKCWAVQIPERPVASEVLAFIVSWRKQTIEIPDTWLQPN